MVLALPTAHAHQRLLDLGRMRCAPIVTAMRFALAARKYLAVDAALEVHRHAIPLAARTLDLGEHRALRAHALEHGIDVRLRDRATRTLDRDAIERAVSDTSGSTSKIAA
jgi:hypothetical protein